MAKRVRGIRFRGDGRRPSLRRRMLFEQLGDRRVLAAITGTIFEDADWSLRKESGEVGLAQRLVFIDSNENQQLDTGEPLTLSEADGSFRFDGLLDGIYSIQVFDGGFSQEQTYPISAVASEIFSISGAGQTIATASETVTLTDGAIVSSDLVTGQSSTIAIAGPLLRMAVLPNGNLLVIGGEEASRVLWTVSREDGIATPVELAPASVVDDEAEGDGEEATPNWSDVAIDAEGRGVVLARDGDETRVYGVEASGDGVVVSAAATPAPLASNSHVITSATGPRSVISSTGEDGLELTLWSNVTASAITNEPVNIPGMTEMLAFDDGAGLLVLKTAAGGVSVHDVDAEFAVIHELADVGGPVALDATRELLLAVSADATLQIIDLRDGVVLGDLPLDLEAIGHAQSLVPTGAFGTVVVVGASGLREVTFNRPTAHRVATKSGQTVGPIGFGLHLTSENNAPVLANLPQFTIEEDSQLTVDAHLLASFATDGDGDELLFVQSGEPANGDATLEPSGALRYEPDPNFNGSDIIPVLLHDGHAATYAELHVSVTPVADPPVGVQLNFRPFPENLPLQSAIAEIVVLDPDADDDYLFTLSDSRFTVENGQLMLVGGGINYEQESQIPLLLTTKDSEASTTITEQLTLNVDDANDPITAILPTTARVFENAVGDVVTELVVEDEDLDQYHELTVDDPRFIVEFGELRLAEGASLDYEVEQSVELEVTAHDPINQESFTQQITVTVQNLPEQPEVLALNGDTVIELEPGDHVGEVLVDGVNPTAGYTFSLDDGRFEITGGRLKLLDNVWVERSTQTEIQIEVGVQDVDEVFPLVSQVFTVQVLANETPFHNDDLPYDVNGNGDVTAIDALNIINFLNRHGPGPVGPGDPGFGYDVNGDGAVTALDALLVINELNRRRGDSFAGPVNGEADGEGDKGGLKVDGSGGEGERERLLAAPSSRIADELAADSTDIAPGVTDEAIAALSGKTLKVTDLSLTQAQASGENLSQSNHAATEDDDASSNMLEQAVDETLRLLSDRIS